MISHVSRATTRDRSAMWSSPTTRCRLLLLDTSGSMHGDAIEQLNQGLATFRKELSADRLAAKRVEIAVVTFGPVEIVSQFGTVDTFDPPPLAANGGTPMGQAIPGRRGAAGLALKGTTAASASDDRPRPFPDDGGLIDDDKHQLGVRGRAAQAARVLRGGRRGRGHGHARGHFGAHPAAAEGLGLRRAVPLAVQLARIGRASSPGDVVALANPALRLTAGRRSTDRWWSGPGPRRAGQGAAHLAAGERRQDSCRIVAPSEACGHLVVVACDGAGSTNRGGSGASLAAWSLAASARGWLAGGGGLPNDDRVMSWFLLARRG